MNCNKIEHKLIFYKDGDLTTEENLLVESHLKTCEACTKKYFQLKNVLSVVSDQKVTDVDPYFYTRTYQRLKNTGTSNARFVNEKFLVPAIQSLLVAASIVIGIFIGLNGNQSNARDAYVNAFAEDYYLFETEFEPLEATIFTENEK
jgi:predicted anti-sigma-YlaC factor YlaD